MTAAGGGQAGTAPRRAAPVPAWVLAVAAVALAAALAATVPADVPVLRGLPEVVARVSVVLVAAGLATGGPRLAPFSVAALTLAATAAVVDEGGPVGAEAVAIGVAGWLCLELASSSLEARSRAARSPRTVLARAGEVAGVAVGGAVVGVAALTVATDVAVEGVLLQSVAVLAVIGLIGLVAWLAGQAAEG